MKTVFLVISAWVIGSALAADKTVEDKATGSDVVEAVIDILNQACVFSDDRQMLRRIAKVETNDGKDDDTFVLDDEDYYGGIWRVSESMYDDALTQRDLFPDIEAAYGIDMSRIRYEDLVKPLYSAIIARIWIDINLAEGDEIPWDQDDQASFWANTYHSLSDTADTDDYLKAVEELEDEGCDLSRADIVFVLDGSTSIEADNFQTMLDFVVEVINSFTVSDAGVHVGVIQYSSSSETEIRLGGITEKLTLTTEVQRLNYMQGSTNTAEALDEMGSMFDQDGRGNGIPQIGIVVTDGASNDPAATVAAAQKLHDARLTVFAVGVTDGAIMSELQAIGSDPDCIHVFLLNDFSDISPFTSKIEEQACKAPAELLPETDVDGSVETGKRVFFKLKIKKNKNGLTIKLKMRSGAGRLFVSFKARNPGSASYKYQLRVDSSRKSPSTMHIQFPTTDDLIDATLDELDLFVALLGEGFGQSNDYTIGTYDGDQSGSAGLGQGITGLLLAALITAVWGSKQ